MKSVRTFRIALFSLVLALPLMFAGCEELETMLAEDSSNTSGSTNVNGSYRLVAVNDRPLPFTMQQIDINNRLVLESGTWTVNGSTLLTNMRGFMVVSGARTSWTENHTGTITVRGSTATAVLDQRSGATVQASISGGTLLMDQNGNRMKFQKQ